MGNLLCLVQVDQSTVAIKETFGKFDEILDPGCHFLPWFLGSQIAGHLSLRVQQLDVRCETKTKVCLFAIRTPLIPLCYFLSFFFPFYFRVGRTYLPHELSESISIHSYLYWLNFVSYLVLLCCLQYTVVLLSTMNGNLVFIHVGVCYSNDLWLSSGS